MKNRELTVRQLEKQARRLERRRRIRESISQNGGDILHSVNFQKTRKKLVRSIACKVVIPYRLYIIAYFTQNANTFYANFFRTAKLTCYGSTG